jgi:hypothetical protein
VFAGRRHLLHHSGSGSAILRSANPYNSIPEMTVSI